MSNVKKSKWSNYAFGKNNTLTKKVNKLAKEIKKDKPEVKFWTTVYTGDANLFLDNGYTFNISTIPRDTSSTGRIGSKINMLNAKLKIYFYTGSVNHVRIIIAADKSPATGVLSYTSVCDNLAVLANYNMDNSKRYKILKDDTFTMNLTDKINIYKSYNINLKNMVQEYSVADASEYNAIRVILLSDNISEATGIPFYFTTKINYTDA